MCRAKHIRTDVIRQTAQERERGEERERERKRHTEGRHEEKGAERTATIPRSRTRIK